MNEQTIELYEQAVEFTKNYHNDNPKATQKELNDVCASKFSELFIRECAEVCKAQSTYDPIVLPYKPSEQFEKAIRQHFGVK